MISKFLYCYCFYFLCFVKIRTMPATNALHHTQVKIAYKWEFVGCFYLFGTGSLWAWAWCTSFTSLTKKEFAVDILFMGLIISTPHSLFGWLSLALCTYSEKYVIWTHVTLILGTVLWKIRQMYNFCHSLLQFCGSGLGSLSRIRIFLSQIQGLKDSGSA